ncbi:transglycosylase family protein [Streptomyces platensis]|uniref:LysM peptidoglycan-binding domain-containing protein n=1 Tax=Streptomyces platensis TaxID=58346 RepID=UPI002E80064A|nr:transglycosylase family protein [Streptomyces platensis]WUB81759.1 transglycosylase family protein [Streptomyces platensis]
MRSGNGRHRRPRQAPAIFVTAGVTGAGFALPLLGASGAHAADTATWDKVAQCESAGVWSAASGNGYYGGLQLTQEMWDNYGGSAYASRPDYASRSQQIAVAESILDDRGPDAWPSCAVNAGLTSDGKAPEVDPGSTSTPAPDPSDSQGSLDPWDTSGSSRSDDHGDSAGKDDAPRDEHGDESDKRPSDATPSPDASDSGEPGDASTSPEPSDPAAPGDRDDDRDPSQSADPSDDAPSDDDPSGSPSTDPSGDGSRTDSTGTPREVPAKGKHRGEAGDEDAGDSDDGRSGGRHASRGDDAHRTGPAAGGDYTVRPGDSLSAIAAAHRLSGGWTALYDRNEGVIGADADLIQPGQQLDLGRNAG